MMRSQANRNSHHCAKTAPTDETQNVVHVAAPAVALSPGTPPPPPVAVAAVGPGGGGAPADCANHLFPPPLGSAAVPVGLAGGQQRNSSPNERNLDTPSPIRPTPGTCNGLGLRTPNQVVFMEEQGKMPSGQADTMHQLLERLFLTGVYGTTFAVQGIDYDVLLVASPLDLLKFGVKNPHHRSAIMHEVLRCTAYRLAPPNPDTPTKSSATQNPKESSAKWTAAVGPGGGGAPADCANHLFPPPLGSAAVPVLPVGEAEEESTGNDRQTPSNGQTDLVGYPLTTGTTPSSVAHSSSAAEEEGKGNGNGVPPVARGAVPVGATVGAEVVPPVPSALAAVHAGGGGAEAEALLALLPLGGGGGAGGGGGGLANVSPSADNHEKAQQQQQEAAAEEAEAAAEEEENSNAENQSIDNQPNPTIDTSAHGGQSLSSSRVGRVLPVPSRRVDDEFGTKVGPVATVESCAAMLEDGPPVWSNLPSSRFPRPQISDPSVGDDDCVETKVYLKPLEAVLLSLLFAGKKVDTAATVKDTGEEEGEDVHPPRHDVALLSQFARKMEMPAVLQGQAPKITIDYGVLPNRWWSYDTACRAAPIYEFWNYRVDDQNFSARHSVMRWDREWVQRAYGSFQPPASIRNSSVGIDSDDDEEEAEYGVNAPWLLAGWFGVLPPFELCESAMTSVFNESEDDKVCAVAPLRSTVCGAIMGNQFDVLRALSQHFPQGMDVPVDRDFMIAMIHSELSPSKIFSVVPPGGMIDYLCEVDRFELRHTLGMALEHWDVFTFLLKNLQDNTDGSIDVTELLTQSPESILRTSLCLFGLDRFKQCLSLCDREKITVEVQLMMLLEADTRARRDNDIVAFRYMWGAFRSLSSVATRKSILKVVSEEGTGRYKQNGAVFDLMKFFVEEAELDCEEVFEKYASDGNYFSEEAVKYFCARGCDFTKLSSASHYRLLHVALMSSEDPTEKKERLQFLLGDMKIDVNAVETRPNRNALCTAVAQCDIQACRFLLDRGAELRSQPVLFELPKLFLLCPDAPPAKALEMAKFLVEDCRLDPVTDTIDVRGPLPFLLRFYDRCTHDVILTKKWKETRRTLIRYFIPFFDHCVVAVFGAPVLHTPHDHIVSELIGCGAKCDPNWRSAEGNVSYIHLVAHSCSLEAAKAIIGSTGVEAARTNEKCALDSLMGIVSPHRPGEPSSTTISLTVLEVALKRSYDSREDAVAFLSYFINVVKVHGHDTPELDTLLADLPYRNRITRGELAVPQHFSPCCRPSTTSRKRARDDSSSVGQEGLPLPEADEMHRMAGLPFPATSINCSPVRQRRFLTHSVSVLPAETTATAASPLPDPACFEPDPE